MIKNTFNNGAVLTLSQQLFEAINRGSTRTFTRLLKKCPDVDKERDVVGNTLLMIAIARGRKSMMHQLIDKGTDINAENEVGNTALMFAAGYHPTFLPLLLGKGADLDKRNRYGETALDWARKNASWARKNASDEAVRILAGTAEAGKARSEEEARAKAAAREELLRRVSSPALEEDMPLRELIKLPKRKRPPAP